MTDPADQTVVRAVRRFESGQKEPVRFGLLVNRGSVRVDERHSALSTKRNVVVAVGVSVLRRFVETFGFFVFGVKLWQVFV